MNLCPFAGSVFREARIRYLVSEAQDDRQRLEELWTEINRLAQADRQETETSLIIYPDQLEEFETEYLNFLDLAESLLIKSGWEGEIQLASFHPKYQFAGTDTQAVEKFHQPFSLSDVAFAKRGEHF